MKFRLGGSAKQELMNQGSFHNPLTLMEKKIRQRVKQADDSLVTRFALAADILFPFRQCSLSAKSWGKVSSPAHGGNRHGKFHGPFEGPLISCWNFRSRGWVWPENPAHGLHPPS